MVKVLAHYVFFQEFYSFRPYVHFKSIVDFSVWCKIAVYFTLLHVAVHIAFLFSVLFAIPVHLFLCMIWWLRQYSICLQCGRPRFNPWVGKIPWRRKWQPTPVFLPGTFHGLRSLVGYSPWGRKESDMTEQLSLSPSFIKMSFDTFIIPFIFMRFKHILHILT